MKLVRANDSQKSERDRLTLEAWGQRLDLEQWLVREKRLRAHGWSREAMCTWLLLDGTGVVLSSCETFQMNSFVRGLAGLSIGFASVFTEKKYRGKGYARRLVGLVTENLKEELKRGGRGLQSFVLFSEVGEAIYASVGFNAVPSYERLFASVKRASSSSLELLNEDKILRLWRELPLPKTEFVIWPSVEQIDWHLERERVYAELLREKRPEFHGAAVGMSLIVWCADYKAQLLQTIFLQARNTLEAQSLLVKGADVAASLGLKGLVVWESEGFSGWERLGIYSERVRREAGIAMLLPVASIQASDWSLVSRAIWV